MAQEEVENWDNLSDEDFMAALDDAAAGGPVEDIEDTDQDTDETYDETEEAETNVEHDDDNMETDDTGSEEGTDQPEENAQAEEDESPEDTTGEQENTSTENQNEETEEKADDKPLDYKSEYAKILEEKKRYEDFYNKVTGEFVANGRKMRGFDDPDKIIRAQQMAAGYAEKVAAFKPYKKYINTLKNKGLLDDPDKFNLAMNILDGDTEAIKKVLKDSNIDPIELDIDNVNYVPKNEIVSDIEVALDDVLETATQNGVGDQVKNIIANEWDDDSVVELLEDPQNSADLVEHLSSGVFDVVQDRIMEKRRTDVNGIYTRKPMIQQYREAAYELENEYLQALQQQQYQQQLAMQQQAAQQAQMQNQGVQNNDTGSQANQNWIPAEQQDEYQAKVEKQIAKTNEARRKASSLSKKKRATRKPRQEVDPLALDDDKFTEFIDSIAYQ